MMIVEFNDDDEEENTDYDNDVYDDDVHNDEVDDVVLSLKPKSSSFKNTWDNINDTSNNDKVTLLDSWDKK